MSKTVKHTAAPWAVHPKKAQVDAFDDGGMPFPVCQLLWPTDKRSEDETEANAKLISSAPYLLESLKEMIIAFGVDGHGQAFEDGECLIVDRARKAVFLASGEKL